MAFQTLSGGPGGLQIISPVLSNVARQWRPHGFIYDMLTSAQPTATNIGQYPVFNFAKFYSARGDAGVADDAATPQIDFEWETEFYHCKDFRLRTRVTRKELNQANDALRLEVSKVTGLVGIMALEREKRLATVLRAEANGGKLTNAAQSVSVKWDEGTEATPATVQKDIQKAVKTVYKKIGFRPNILQITETIAVALSQDPTIQGLVKYLAGVELVQSGNVGGAGPGLNAYNGGLQSVAGGSAVLPKKLFGLELVVADGVLENTAPEGATGTLAEVWGNSARVLYVNKNAVWGAPTVAYAFRGRVAGGFEQQLSTAPGSITQFEPSAGSEQWAVVDRWQEPDPPGENIRAWECVDEHIVAPEAGVEIASVLGTP